MKQKISFLMSRIINKQSVTQRSYLSSFTSLLTLLLIGCCTTSFASQNNISNPHTNSDSKKLWEQCYELWNKKDAFVNDRVSEQNDIIQSWMALRKFYLDFGVSSDLRDNCIKFIDNCIKMEMCWLQFLKDYQTFYFDKEDKYESFIYSHELVEKEGS